MVNITEPGSPSKNPIQWKKDALGHSAINVKTTLKGFKPMVDEGIISARLGKDRRRPSSFSYSSDFVSIAARVQKGADRDVCQDAAFVLIHPKATAIGVVDGFGPAGTEISALVADAMMSLVASGSTNPLRKAADAIGRMCSRKGPSAKGGATAACAVIFQRGAYAAFAAESISDSAAFKIQNGGASRRLYSYGRDYGGRDVSKMDLVEYLATRHIVSQVIEFGRSNADSISTDGGVLEPGEGIILSTDGLTKVLAVGYSPATGLVTDNSGSGDLHGILQGTRTPLEAVDSLFSEIDARLKVPQEPWTPLLLQGGMALYPEPDDVAVVAACI